MTNKGSFQFKADFVPLTVVKLKQHDLSCFQQQLKETIEQAPNYFTHAPIVIDVNGLTKLDCLDLSGLCQALKACKILPIGIKGLPQKLHNKAHEHGLAIMAAEKKVEKKIKQHNDAAPKSRTRIVTKPVRSGTQVYAKDADLIVMSTVNPGGEVVADGNIHVYGALKGRALAGARGDTEARIFCEKLDAELISVAGHYLVKENIELPKFKNPMIQVYLDQQTLKIEGI